MIKLKDLLNEANEDSQLASLEKTLSKLRIEIDGFIGEMEDLESEEDGETKHEKELHSLLVQYRKLDKLQDTAHDKVKVIEKRRRKAAGTWT